MDMSLLKEVMPQEVEELPWDIDGNVIFKMKCEDFCNDSVSDGHWWKVVQSSRKDLEGEGSLQLAWGLTFAIIQSVLNIPQKRWRTSLISSKGQREVTLARYVDTMLVGSTVVL